MGISLFGMKVPQYGSSKALFSHPKRCWVSGFGEFVRSLHSGIGKDDLSLHLTTSALCLLDRYFWTSSGFQTQPIFPSLSTAIFPDASR